MGGGQRNLERGVGCEKSGRLLEGVDGDGRRIPFFASVGFLGDDRVVTSDGGHA